MPQASQQGKTATKEILDCLIVRAGILVTQTVSHPITRLVKKSRSCEELLLRGYQSGSQNPFSINGV